MKGTVRYDESMVESMIHSIRGHRAILDADLARIYGVPTKRLNEQVRRNVTRFPSDFAFRLTLGEVAGLRSQASTPHLQHPYNQQDISMRSQIATASKRNIRHLPYAFTAHGALMAANLLSSTRAVQMSIFVVRAFIQMRQMLNTPRELAGELAALEKKLTARLDGHETAITEVLRQIMLLLNPSPDPVPPPKQIGFLAKEKRARYRLRHLRRP